jgi:hypothetical protein
MHERQRGTADRYGRTYRIPVASARSYLGNARRRTAQASERRGPGIG